MSRRIPSDWVCIKCKNPSQKHYGLDLCKKCYMEAFRRRRGIAPAHHRIQKPCVKCGAVSWVKGRGLCRSCYAKYFRETHSKYMADLDRELGDRKRFGGRREQIMQKTDGRCAHCRMTDEASIKRWGKRLEVHHKDGNNSESAHPNHSFGNLQLLCKLCHRAIHGDVRKKVAS